MTLFTYVHSGILDGSASFEGGDRLLRDVARLEESRTFGLSPERLAEFLRDRGLCLDCDLSGREYRSHYFGMAAQRMKGYEFYHVAVACLRQGLVFHSVLARNHESPLAAAPTSEFRTSPAIR